MKKIKTFYAILIGINDYPKNPLTGCINDVLVVHKYFEKICQTQEETTIWKPVFILAPLEEEKKKIQALGFNYLRPTRQNVINSFDQLQTENIGKQDCILLYYSGHGSYVYSSRVPLFENYEPSGKLQSIICLDEDAETKRMHHLLDKELGYLIAKLLKKGKHVDPDTHFLSIMDCCHSGTNTKLGTSRLKARMHRSQGITLPKIPHGFTKTGNCFYAPFKKGQSKVQSGGITSARYISLAAAQNAESAYELSLLFGHKENKSHGIFTFSLLDALEQNGTKISYRELMQRVQMKVRSKVSGQVPYLDSTLLRDVDLYFLKNKFSPAKKEYLISFREDPCGEWILNAGAIQGIIPSSKLHTTKFKLTDGSDRIVVVKEVRATESVLEERGFLERDKSDDLLRAVVYEMAYPKLKISFKEGMSIDSVEQLKQAFASSNPSYFNLVDINHPHDLEITEAEEIEHAKSYLVTRIGSSIPLFKPHTNASVLLRDVDKIARYETIIQMDSPRSNRLRSDFEIKIRILEGKEFNTETLNDIPLEEYRTCDPNAENIKAHFEIVAGRYQQPALKLAIKCRNASQKNYWIGALYCDAQFGITDQYLEIQRIGKAYTNRVEMGFALEEEGTIRKWHAIPLSMNPNWHQLGVTEIQDYILIFISDAPQPFSLEKYNQEPIILDQVRGVSFLPDTYPQKENWQLIKVPIKIIWPLELTPNLPPPNDTQRHEYS